MWSLSDNDVWEWNKRRKEPFVSRTNTLLVGIFKLMGGVSVSIVIDNYPPPPGPTPVQKFKWKVQKHVGKGLD